MPIRKKQDRKEYYRERYRLQREEEIKERNKERMELLLATLNAIELKCKELGLINDLEVDSLEDAEKLFQLIYKLPNALRCPNCKQFQIYLSKWYKIRGKMICHECQTKITSRKV